MSVSDAHTTILVLHPSSLDPGSYIRRLTAENISNIKSDSVPESPSGRQAEGVDQEGDEDADPDVDVDEDEPRPTGDVDWTIDNKYYTAQVTFRTRPQEMLDMTGLQDVEVVVYLFCDQINSVHPSVVRVMAEPRDVALAIRLPPSSRTNDKATKLDTFRSDAPKAEIEYEELEVMFDEVGMEFMDERHPLDDDDERPVPVIERVRQTLMTHMWPNMVRKPLSSSTRGINEFSSSDLDPLDEHDDVDEDEDEGPDSGFPTAFATASSGPSHRTDRSGRTGELISDDKPDGTGGTGGTGGEFPGLDELKSQIMLEETERIARGGRVGGLSRLEMMDQDLDLELDLDEDERDEDYWVQAEYSRLDDWLDEDEVQGVQLPDEQTEPEADDEDLRNRHTERIGPHLSHGPSRTGDGDGDGNETRPIPDSSRFDDDFADFTPFQSAPAPAPLQPSGGSSTPMDPTPLLLHLQNVREELAGLDESTRRARAGREVENVLKSLGLGGLDWDDGDGDELLEDLDHLLPSGPGDRE